MTWIENTTWEIDEIVREPLGETQDVVQQQIDRIKVKIINLLYISFLSNTS